MSVNLSFIYEEGIELLTEYIDYKTPISIKCSKGHITKVSVNTAKTRYNRNNFICKECNEYKNKSRLKNRISNLLNKKGYVLISEEVSYENKLEYRCDKGHIHSTYISNLLNGKGCPICANNDVVSDNIIRETLRKENYEVLTIPFGSKAKFDVKCPKGHVFQTSYDNFVNRKRRCPICSTSVSDMELELFEFIKSISSSVIKNDRSLIKPKELDIVIPDKKIAIEFNGLYWHSENRGKDKKYHINKLESCERINYKLITIFEDEWITNKSICKSRLKSIINQQKLKRIFARKCVVKEITGSKAKDFCDKNHIQKYGSGSTIKLGLFYNEELVSVMTFSKPSLAKGIKKIKDNEYELHRFCTIVDTTVVGGASKLFKYFERNYKCNYIFTFADRRWSDGNLYYKLGFTKVSYTDPCYYYFKEGSLRYHRFLFRKNVLKDKLNKFDSKLTEVQNMYNNGYNRIWDCGSIKFEKIYN